VKYLVIANPVCGHGSGFKQIPVIEKTLKQCRLDYNLVITERPWHAADLAEQAARDGYEVIVAAGGDGTVNEALNGLMRVHSAAVNQPALGVISIGTGNDFAASMGIPSKLGAACSTLKEDRRHTIDIGLVKGQGCQTSESRYFGNCVGIGFDAAGTIQSQKITWAHGMLAYLIAAIQTIFWYYKAPNLEIDLDGERVELPALLVSVMNGKRIGGGFWTGPESLPDDGLFDLCIAREVSRTRMFTLIPHFLKGSQASQPEIQTARAKHVVVTATNGTMPVQVDGEIICTEGRKLEIKILPRQLEIVGGALS